MFNMLYHSDWQYIG